MPDAPSDTGETGRRLDPVIADLEATLRAADGALVLLDFDGTLAPIVEDPDAATPLSGVPDAVRTLRDGEGVVVGLVSGRALADLRERIGVEDMYAAGNHGLELHDPAADDSPIVHESAREASETIRDLAADVERRLADVEGARVEDKRVTATVHYRAVADASVPDVKRAVREAVAEREADVRVTSGKAIREIRPDVDWDKGAAVEWVRDRTTPDDERWPVVYAGDDVTDEDAFAVIEEGVGIRVGEEAETAADHRIDGPEAARELVQWLAESGRRLAAGGDE
jgi:trehalose 6-phosphate phosphatase